MTLRDKIPAILAHIEAMQARLAYNKKIFSMIDGEMLPAIYEAIDRQLTGESAKVAKDRVAPINLLRKVTDKLSTLYSEKPERETAVASDQELLNFYVSEIDIDATLANTDESFNAVKYGIVEIYYDSRTKSVAVRPCEPDKVLPYSDDPIDATRPTVMIKFMGGIVKRKDGKPLNGTETKNQRKSFATYMIYSDDEILFIDESGAVLTDEMNAREMDGVNHFRIIPFSFVQRSKYSLIPKQDDDMLAMAVLIPLLLSEANFAMMFLANPIIYGVDVDTKGLQVSPLAFWSVSSNNGQGGTLDVLKPDMNIEATAKWVKEQLIMWLDTKNIKAKGLADQSGSSAQSGISLLLEEMDTSEDRAKQATFFKAFEADFWYRFGVIHNALSQGLLISELRKFSNNLSVKTTFKPIKLIEDKTQVEQRANAGVQAGTKSVETAVRELHQNWTDEEVLKEVEAIKSERNTREITGNDTNI